MPDSKEYFQRKLNLAWRSHNARNFAGGSVRCGHAARLYRRKQVQAWQAIIRVIENIEELRPELHIEGFRDFRNLRVFDKRKVQVVQQRSPHRASSQVAER